MKTFKDFVKLRLDEISTDQLEKITDKLDRYNKQQFDDFDEIFGNKLRIVIPLQVKNQHHNLSSVFKKLGYDIDFEQGTAKSTMQTQQGPKVRHERLGSLLTKLHKKDPHGNWDQWLDWWQKKGNKVDAASPMSVIISRSPIDVIRMSDHRDIESCHSPPQNSNTREWKMGTWHKCARQEALTGGAIAYAVRTEDLQAVSNLQAPEIFLDRDRRVGNIQPLERVRLRKFSDGKTNILVPEDRTYGIHHTDFLHTVVNWAKHVQSDAIAKHRDDFKDFELYGGSYQDNDAGELWSKFFNVKVNGNRNKVSVNLRDEKAEETKPINIKNTIKRLIDGHHLRHAFMTATVKEDNAEDEDDNQYMLAQPGMIFVFPESVFVKIPTQEDLSRDVGQNLRAYLAYEVLSFNDITVRQHEGKVSFILNFEPLKFRGNIIEKLESELDLLHMIDDEYRTHYANFFDVLRNQGFAQTLLADLTHFNKKGHKYVSDPIWLGNADEFMRSTTYSKKKMELAFPMDIHRYIADIFPFQIITYMDISVDADNAGRLYLQLSVPANFQNYNKFVKVIKHIEKHWDYYVQRSNQWLEMVKSKYGEYKRQSQSFPGAPRFNPPRIPLKIPRTPKSLDFKDWVNHG